MDDVLGSRGLDEGDSVELTQENDEPAEVRFGVWAEEDGACVLGDECIGEPGDEDPGAIGALGGMEELAKENLEFLYRYGGGGEELNGESLGFFHLGRIDGHGQADGVKHYSNPSDDGGVNYLLAAMIKDHKPLNTSRKLYYKSKRCSLFSAQFKTDG